MKGSRIGVSGRLEWQEWEKDGVRRQAIKLIADEIQLLDSKKSGDDRPSQPSGSDLPASTDHSPATYDDDDIPF